MHQRLTHASVARVLKACRDAGIKISDKEAPRVSLQVVLTSQIDEDHFAPAAGASGAPAGRDHGRYN